MVEQEQMMTTKADWGGYRPMIARRLADEAERSRRSAGGRQNG